MKPIVVIILGCLCISCTMQRHIISTTAIPNIKKPESNSIPLVLDDSPDDDDTPDITGEQVDMSIPLETEVTKNIKDTTGPLPIQRVYLDKPVEIKCCNVYDLPPIDVDKGLL